MNFSQRTLGDKIRDNENINLTFWKKLTKIFEDMFAKDYFSLSYPLIYPDFDNHYSISEARFANCVYGCNKKELSEDITFHVGEEFSWPLATNKKISTSKLKITSQYILEDWKPSELQAFDLIEFLYNKTNTAKVNIYYPQNSYGEDDQIKTLDFPKNDNSAKVYFAKKINTLLRDAKMIYEFDPEVGQIKTILNDGTKQLIDKALNLSEFTFDSEYQYFLKGACEEIASSRLEINYEALKKLWDAYDRLKCYFGATNQKNKIKSINIIQDLFSSNTTFSDIVNLEMEFLTNFGNKYLIRHSEPYQKSLKNRREINYIFNRCLSLIILIQDEIVADQKM